MKAAAAAPPPLGLSVKLSYGLGSVAMGMALAVLSPSVLQLYFNQVLGIPALWVGASILISLTIDAVMDPLIGQWSDGLRTRWGRRHPFMYAAAIPVAVSFFLVWHAPRSLSLVQLFGFSIAMILGVRLALSAYEIPSNALGPELAPDYDERTTLYAYRWFFMVVTVAVASWVLYSVFLKQGAANPQGVLNRDRYAQFGVLGAIVMFACIAISTAATHNRIPYLHRPSGPRIGAVETFRQIASTFANPSLLAIVFASILGGASYGINNGLSTYFYLHLWGLQPQMIGPLVAGGLLAGVIGIFGAPAISKALGKKRSMRVLFACSMVAGLLPISARLIGIMPPNGSKALYILLFGDVVLTAVLALMAYVILSSMIADVAEDQAIRAGGTRSEGVLFAANGLVTKITTGVGAFFAGLLLTAVGFPVHAAAGSVPPEVIRHLAMLYIPCIVVLSGSSIAVLQFYRIDRSLHEQNLARLREAAALADTGGLSAVAPNTDQAA